ALRAIPLGGNPAQLGHHRNISARAVVGAPGDRVRIFRRAETQIRPVSTAAPSGGFFYPNYISRSRGSAFRFATAATPELWRGGLPCEPASQRPRQPATRVEYRCTRTAL